MALSVAVQVYSVRDFAEQDMRGTLQKIKDMGYAGVEFAGLYGNDPVEVKKACEEIGLVPLSAHVPFVDLMEKMDENNAKRDGDWDMLKKDMEYMKGEIADIKGCLNGKLEDYKKSKYEKNAV